MDADSLKFMLDNGRTSSSPVRKSRIGKGEQLLKKAAAFFAKEID